MPELNQVKATTEWEGGNRELFDRRLDETMTVFRALGSSFAQAGAALEHFVPELTKAKQFFSDGDELGDQLTTVMKRIPAWNDQTDDFHNAEPLRQWEDLSHTTGFWDWWVDPLWIDDDVETKANPLSEQIHHTYSEAKRVEETARAACVADLRKAFALLPDLRTDSRQTEEIIKHTDALQHEMTEAAHDPNVRLPGMGETPSFDDPAVTSSISPDLQDLRDRAATLPGVNVTWDSSDFARWKLGIGESEEDFKL
jgi:hypothetical protein